MAEQQEFLKKARKSLTDAQAKATARIESLEGDAKKVLGELVEKGRHGQKDIAERINKLAQSEMIQKKVRPAAEEALKKVAGPDYKQKLEKMGQDLSVRVKELQKKAMEFVGVSSREQVTALATELHKLAEKLEKLAKKPEPKVEPVAAPDVH